MERAIYREWRVLYQTAKDIKTYFDAHNTSNPLEAIVGSFSFLFGFFLAKIIRLNL